MSKRKKYAILFTGLITLVSGIIGFCIATASSNPAWHPQQFTIAGGKPCLLQDGQVYQYAGEKRWEQIQLPQAVKQLFPGETFWVLFEGGRLYTTEPPVREEYMPLTSAFYVEMTRQLLEINETHPFSQVSSNTSYSDVLILLPDGTVLALQEGAYRPCELEQKAAAVSGRYILTQQGSLYYLEENMTVPLCIHHEQNITDITTDAFDQSSCLALTDDGQALSFGRTWQWMFSEDMTLAWTSLSTEDWCHVISLAQGHNFAAGLTEQGEILFTGTLAEEDLSEIQRILSGWRHIIAIAAYNTEIYGLQADGACVCLELKDFLYAR